MPYADPKKQAAYMRSYWLRHRDQISAERRLELATDAEKREAERKRAKEKNLAAGHKPRTKGRMASEELEVPTSRKWLLKDGKIFFTNRRGFTLAELDLARKALELIDPLKAPPEKKPAKNHPSK